MDDKRKVVAIIQARMGSSRLPGKVLKDIAGKPMLGRVVERTQKAKMIDEVVIATTLDTSDDAVAEFCCSVRIQCFRGSVFDVLDRFYQAARSFTADIVVRLTGDCPLLDPELIDKAIVELESNNLDFAANRLPPPWKRTYPVGLDVEVCTFAALERAWKEAEKPFEREHVMPYLYDEKDRFRVSVLEADEDHSDQRWTVDTPEDLELMRKVYGYFKNIKAFSWKDVLDYFKEHPELSRINAGASQKSALDLDDRYKK